MPDLKQLLRFYRGKYLVFDFETESLNLRESRPWQVAYIYHDGHDSKSFQGNILWNDINVSEGAALVTRFNKNHYLETAHDGATLLVEFDSYVYDPECLIIVFNGLNFDIYQHDSWRTRLGHKTDWSYTNRVIDVHCLYKAYKFGIQVDENTDLELWQRKLANTFRRGTKTNLSAMSKEFAINVDETKTHEGLYDSELTLEGFNKLKYLLNVASPI